jgi:hypothetical protein
MQRPLAASLLLLLPLLAPAADPTRVLPEGKTPDDSRVTATRKLDKDYFPMVVPASKEAWEARRRELREQTLVANGLWPLPEKTPLNAVVHGKIERDGYTVEKVFFASMPGHYVCGNLYRPTGKSGKLPAVLTPHGHWTNARLSDQGAAAAKKQIEEKAEQYEKNARFFLHAMCAQLARMGCVAFFYDMVGNSDSTTINHAAGFTDADALLRLQSAMGLQTWNSIRALDFVLSLPEVDPNRVGITGASGGGTQSFLLSGIDDRIAASFPAVMVSTAMQGGCVCENAPYLRVGCGNIDLAALTAPRPLGMTGARDWTIDIETKGLPELKALYKMLGAEDAVMAKCFPQFGHNYNQVSREVMYNFFNKHLKLAHEGTVTEKEIEPIPPKELSVFDEKHPRPKDSLDVERLKQVMAEASDKQIEALRPKDAKGFEEFRRVVGGALRSMVVDKLPAPSDVEAKAVGDVTAEDGAQWQKLLLSRKDSKEQVPAVLVRGKEFNGTLVVWVHPAGKASLRLADKLVPEARQILDGKGGILAVDVFLTGEYGDAKPRDLDGRYAGYTLGYNRALLADRVHDILTAVAFARGEKGTKAIHLVGWEKAGPWVVLARGLCGDAVVRTAADLDGFRFEKVRKTADEMMLPGALKYGGLPAFAALAAPSELHLHNHHGTGSGHWVKAAYEAAGKNDRLTRSSEKAAADKVVGWLMR